MTSADLIVDYEELEASQQALEKITTEFMHTTDRVSANEDIWSDGDVAGAMNSFASNWKDHRATLINKMNDAHDHSQKCLDYFRSTDQRLASAVDVQGGGRTRAE